MSVSKSFKETIKAHLDKLAQSDNLFAVAYKNESKNLDECCDFIVSEVKKMNVNGLSDEEVYGLAVHYYEESDLGKIQSTNCRVVVNHVVELTEEEKEQARKDAIEKMQQEEIRRLRAEEKEKAEKAKKKAPTKPQTAVAQSPSLFEMFEDETEE